MVREVWQTACSIWLTYYSGGVASHWNWDRLWQHEPLGSWTKLDSLVVNKFLLGREEPSKTSLASNVWLCNSLGSWAQSLRGMNTNPVEAWIYPGLFSAMAEIAFYLRRSFRRITKSLNNIVRLVCQECFLRTVRRPKNLTCQKWHICYVFIVI